MEVDSHDATLSKDRLVMDPLYEDDEVDNDLEDGVVMTKYRLAADICNAAMERVLAAVGPGVRIVDLCKTGDDYILAEAEKNFRKNKVERGIAFPTCVSVNAVTCNFSPATLDDPSVLEVGDVVKVELGAHIDGYISTSAFTTVVSADVSQPIVGCDANVVAAAYVASEVCSRLVRPGVLSTELTAAINRVAQAFHVRPMARTYSWEMRRFLLEGQRRIPSFLSNANGSEDVAMSRELINSRDAAQSASNMDKPFVLEAGRVYQINIMMTTNSVCDEAREVVNTTTHKVNATTAKPCVLQRNVSVNYNCKLRASRAVLNEVDRSFGVFPFAARALKQPNPIFTELLNHGLLEYLPVEASFHPSDKVAHFKFTIMCLNHPIRLTSQHQAHLPNIASVYSTDSDPEITKLLKTVHVRTVQ